MWGAVACLVFFRKYLQPRSTSSYSTKSSLTNICASSHREGARSIPFWYNSQLHVKRDLFLYTWRVFRDSDVVFLCILVDITKIPSITNTIYW